MSLQRVLETARRAGMPVIVTDVAGREPLVVLPLEQFETMLGKGKTAQSSIQVPVAPPEVKRAVERAAVEVALEKAAPVVETAPIEAPATVLADELSPEEQFYFEPMDDKNG